MYHPDDELLFFDGRDDAVVAQAQASTIPLGNVSPLL